MNETLADVYAITGDRRYLVLAKRFSHRAILDPLLKREDRLDGLHANTQIPKVIGFARIGELDQNPAWIEAAVFFWTTVTQRRSVAFGGNSVREHFNPIRDFSPMIESREGPETCNSYNMLRLTALLYRLDPQPRYAEYYERTLYNHILSAQHPEHGGLVYFTPIRPRHYRIYSQPEQCFWCCVGTGMENPGKHGVFVYAYGPHSLTVNLLVSSTVRWAERGLSLRQETNFPDSPRTQVTLALQRPARFAIRLRHPAWLSGPLAIRLNGRALQVKSAPGGYAILQRRWRDNDRLNIELPMRPRIEALPDDSGYVAIMYGPLVLAAKTGDEALTGLIADDGRGSHIAPGPYLSLDEAPMLIGDRESLAQKIVALPDRPLTFSAASLIQPTAYQKLELQPRFRIHDARYMVYWRSTTAAAYPAVVRKIEAKERERQRLESRTLDRVIPGEQQPEADHGLQAEESTVGTYLGRAWRDTARWFTYEMRAPKGAAIAQIRLTFAGADKNDGFKLLVNDREIATIALSGDKPDEFVDLTFDVPGELADLAMTANLQIKLLAGAKRTARLFDLRLLRAEGLR